MNFSLENTLRIKTTQKCNRACTFCHKEGGMEGLDDILYSDELGHIINDICTKLNIFSIAFTGGEPLMHDGLFDFTLSIATNTAIQKFSLTTNGTIQKTYEFWRNFYDLGLGKVNISIPDILQSATGNITDNETASMLSRQINLIKILNCVGVNVDINVVIFNDYMHTEEVIKTLLKIKIERELSFNINLLPNLLSDLEYKKSQMVIEKVKSDMLFSLKSKAARRGTSNHIETYQANDGTIFYIKSTKPDNKFPYLLENGPCSKCELKRHCQEGFYGLRLEQIAGIFYIRLCIHKSTPDVLMPYQDFIHSNTYKILKSQWNEKSE